MNLKSLIKESKNIKLFEADNQKVNAYPIVTVTYDNTFTFEYEIDDENTSKVVEVALPCSNVDSKDVNFSEEWMQKYLKDKTSFTVDNVVKGLAIEGFKKEKTLIDPEKVDTSKLSFRVTSIGYEPYDANEK